jgi:hypothetical protein
MTQAEINALLLSAVNDLWTEHYGSYTVQPNEPDYAEKVAAGKARIAWVEDMRAILAEAAKATS